MIYIVGFCSGLIANLVAVLFFSFSHNVVGLGPIPFTINAEIHLPESLASPIAVAFNWSGAFVVTKVYASYEGLVTIQGAFLTFGFINFVGE